MKIKYFLFTSLFGLSICLSHAQNIWTQVGDFGGEVRDAAVGFTINNKGFIGTGTAAGGQIKTFWEYDPSLDVWTQKADFGGAARVYAAGFSIGNKGYIGTGRMGDYGFMNDFWEYNPDTNAWTQKANFGGTARQGATGLSIGDKGYIGLGGKNTNKNDFWQYDPATDTWTQKANFGGDKIGGAVGFSIAYKGYIGTGGGDGGNNGQHKDFWEYDPSTNTWTQKADFGGTERSSAVGFSIGDKGYIGTGYDFAYQYKKDFWEYDPITDSWTQKTDFGGTARSEAVGFCIGGKGYIGTGALTNDFWQYSPECDSIIVYTDADGDNYGDLSNNLVICDSILPIGYVYDNTDCNDGNASIFPNATEVCSNGIDDNCNGLIDENCCSIPSGLATTNITATSAQLNWNTVASATKYKLKYKRDSIGAAWITQTVTAPTTSLLLTGLLHNSKYKWKVKSVCGTGVSSDFSSVLKFTTLLKLGDESTTLTVMDVYPNPFSLTTTISFNLEENSYINIEVYDLTGRKIKTLVDGNLESGDHEVQLNFEQISASIYFLKFKFNGESRSMKIINQ